MKKFFIAAFLFFTAACMAQDTYKVVIDSSSEKPMIVGITPRSAFQDSSFAWWFNSEYDMFNPDTALVDSFKNKLTGTRIVIVMGTWCSDSRREVPRLLKILDYSDYPQNNLTIINVDRKKEAEGTNVKDMNIELVPTIIFYSDNTEIGRIIESPKETLEKDMAAMLK